MSRALSRLYRSRGFFKKTLSEDIDEVYVIYMHYLNSFCTSPTPTIQQVLVKSVSVSQRFKNYDFLQNLCRYLFEIFKNPLLAQNFNN